MNVFTETQRFRQWWLWVLMGFSLLIYISSVPTAAAWKDPGIWSGFVLLLAILLLLYGWRLDTRLDLDGIHYRVFPVLPWRHIPWSAVRSTSVSTYTFIGYGIRWSFEGWVYTIAGNKGVRIVRTNSWNITIGTQRPEELQQFIDQLPVASNQTIR